ncbi:MAG: hypothetical protein CMH83_11640 [Nocardioides sp.]|nr:hypothetical protein [Nocardioides sp.]
MRTTLTSLTVALLVPLAGCGTVTGAADDGAGGEPITQRAIAAVTLEHLPGDTISRAASYTDVDDPQGALGADLRYPDPDDPQSDGYLVRVFLTPSDAVEEQLCAQECVEVEVDGTPLVLRWDELVPEEDPGLVVVERTGAQEQVRVLFAGPSITGDPRDLDLPVSVEDLEAVATDPRLGLTTSAATIALGDDLDDWEGGEPDQGSYERVSSTPTSLAAYWRWSLDAYGDDVPDIVSAEPTPLTAADLGGDVGVSVGVRVVKRPVRTSPYDTIDLLVSEQRPPLFGERPCEDAAFAHCWRGDVTGDGEPTFLVWDDGPDGVVWATHPQAEQAHLTARLTGWDVPAEFDDPMIDQMDWSGLAFGTFGEPDYFGFGTTREWVETPVP